MDPSNNVHRPGSRSMMPRNPKKTESKSQDIVPHLSSPKKNNRVSFTTSSEFVDPSPSNLFAASSTSSNGFGIEESKTTSLSSSFEIASPNSAISIDVRDQEDAKQQIKENGKKNSSEDSLPLEKFSIELESLFKNFFRSTDKKELLKFRLEDMRDKSLIRLESLFNETIQSQKEYLDKKKRSLEKQFEKQWISEIPVGSLKLCCCCKKSEVFESLFHPKECNHSICYPCAMPVISIQVQSFLSVGEGEKTKQRSPQYQCPVSTCKKSISFPIGTAK